MTRIAIPALIIMVVVVGFVGAAGWNQSGAPWLVMTMTERELELPVRVAPPGEDPGMQLRLVYEGRYDPLDARNWLPESRLREIGFSFDVPVGSPAASHSYDHQPARLAWVVFEYDGPQWRDIERRRPLREPDSGANRVPHLRSRLVPVDAGIDFDTLHARYPNGHAILRGVVGLRYVSPENGGPFVHGTLREIIPHQVAVPKRLRHVLDGLSSPVISGASEPRYEVELALGRLGLPYLRGLRRIPPN